MLVAGLTVLTAHLFVWPDLPPLPQHADAIVQLGGPGNRRLVAFNLPRQGRAPLVAVATARLPWYRWPTQIVYQSGATARAYTAETSC